MDEPCRWPACGHSVDPPDGYQAQRSYSIANAPGDGQQAGITVQRVDNGEVSPFLLDDSKSGTRLSCEARLAAISPGSLATVGPFCSWPAAPAWCR